MMADNMYGYNDYNGPLGERVGDESALESQDENDGDDDPLRSGLWMEGDSLAPPCGTSVQTIHQLLAFSKVSPEDVVYDFGCGDGRVCLEALVRFNASECVGVEIEQDLVERFRYLSDRLPSQFLKKKRDQGEAEPRIHAVHDDLRHVLSSLVQRAEGGDVSGALDAQCLPFPTLIVLYLLPEAIAKMEADLLVLLELLDPIRILCNTWGLSRVKPSATLEIEEENAGTTTLVNLYTKDCLSSLEI